MGIYLNPGKTAFWKAVNSEVFVDKTAMIQQLNTLVNTEQMYVCVSRPRRFGKSMAAKMLCAYYGKGEDSRGLFEKSELSRCPAVTVGSTRLEWDAYLGHFDVIRLVMTDFFNSERTVDEGLTVIKSRIIDELADMYPCVRYDKEDFFYSIERFYQSTGTQFVIVIDEWDVIFREYKDDKDGQKKYLDFLRDWMKDKEYIALAYMTGILPIKKYGKHSALNMFDEYSMIHPMQFAQFTGFTRAEVDALCQEYEMDYDNVSDWYDGYSISDWIPVEKRRLYREGKYEEHRIKIYSPYSVVKAVRSGIIDNYWNQTETYEALQQYIDWNFDGLKEDVAILMNGGRITVDITGYQNDMTTFYNKDDILTMLIHLGYLGYDADTKELFIPNQEVLQVFKSSTKNRNWAVTLRALQNSRKLLEATWAFDEEKVAEFIEAAHDKTGNRTYHSEAALSYAIQLAYYSAQDFYTVFPEADTGKGYADLVYIPVQPNIPALLVELKYDKDADTAISQIKRQRYPDRLEHYKGNLIMVGINYNREVSNESPTFKHHSCHIERG